MLQGFRNAYAGITLPNPASVGFHEAVGFVRVGVYHGIGYKFGAWHDVIWLERGLAPRDISPAVPTPLSSVEHTAAFDAALRVGLSLVRTGRG